MPTLQATAPMALLPIGVPVSSPRRVSVTGVKGWYWANCRSPTGMVATGTKPLPRNGSRVRNIGVLLAVSTLLAASPSAVASQIRANANRASRPIAAEPVQPGSAVGSEAEGDRDAEDDGDAGQGLDQAGQHVAGQHGGRARSPWCGSGR